MNIYSRARKHIDMKRVKELKEEKDIADLEQQREIVLAEISRIHKEKNKHCDWRKELKEGMTTTSLGMVNYPAAGDVNLDTAFPSFTLSGSSEIGVNSVVQNMQGDGSKFDTMVVTINSTSSDWVVVHGVELITYGSGGAGTHTVVVPGTHSSLYFSASDDGTFTASVQYQRRKPVNVFVGLDDPEANSFIRDGVSGNLSPKEKKKKLEEQLRSSKEYLDKMFGKGMPGTATQIADYEPQKSFADIAQGLPYTDEDDAFDDPYYTRPQRDLDDDSDFEDPFPDLPLAKGKGNTQIAQAGPGVRYPKFSDAPGSGRTRGQKAPLVPDYKWDPHMQINVPVMPKAEKKQKTMVAHHKPDGKVLAEKKRLKSPKALADKIPGYYDGKPASLGFPIVEPPKMKNGMHPDLVDGKKIAKRFNRLDPISAKAMPKTGNPHIDKKVKAAAKKLK